MSFKFGNAINNSAQILILLPSSNKRKPISKTQNCKFAKQNYTFLKYIKF